MMAQDGEAVKPATSMPSATAKAKRSRTTSKKASTRAIEAAFPTTLLISILPLLAHILSVRDFLALDRHGVTICFALAAGAGLVAAGMLLSRRWPSMRNALLGNSIAATLLAVASGGLLIYWSFSNNASPGLQLAFPQDVASELDVAPPPAPLEFRDANCTFVVANGQTYPETLRSNALSIQKFVTTGYVVESVSFKTVRVSELTDGSTNISGDYGDLTLTADGSYEYELRNPDAVGHFEQFVALVKAPDGGEHRVNIWFSFVGPDGVGTDAGDTFHGTSRANTISGRGAPDYLYGEEGDDLIDGGEGNDRLRGGDGNDILTGATGDDVIYGNAGDDVIDGGTGADQIVGGPGQDRLTGGLGADTFWNVTPDDGGDLITDFSLADGDKLELSNLIETFDPATMSIDDYVMVEGTADGSKVFTDATGGGSAWTLAVELQGAMVDVDKLMATGAIVHCPCN